MRLVFKFLIVASILLFSCNKTENEQDIANIFFGYDDEVGEGLITIKSMEFANTDNDGVFITEWNDNLYSNQMRYLRMRIVYDCNTTKQEQVTIYIKIIHPDGRLSQGTTSPKNYSFSVTFYSSGENRKNVYEDLSGWGNSDKSIYEEGRYFVEIWEENRTPKRLLRQSLQIL